MQTFSRGGGRLLSTPHCSASVLLPSWGGVEGRWVPATRAGGCETFQATAFGQGGERRLGPGLENSSAVRKAPGKAEVGGRLGMGELGGGRDLGLPATIRLPMCSSQSYWPQREGDAGARANRLSAAVAKRTHPGWKSWL